MSKIPINSETVYAARYGDKAAMNELISSLAPTVECIATGYVGRCPMSRSDLIQEGMIGLLGSVYGYDPDEGVRFETFATVCISNRIKSAVRNQLRSKHMPLNGYVDIDDVEISDDMSDPQTMIIMQERFEDLSESIEKKLTDLEKDVLRLHIGGHNYSSIAEMLSISVKSVDNALQRARKKLKEK